MSSLFDQAVKKSETIGTWQSHPLGRYTGVITNVAAQRDTTAGPVVDITITTEAGTARQSVWVNYEADIKGRLLTKAQGDLKKAEANYIDGIARTIYLYSICGFGKPTSELQVYASLQHLKGKTVDIDVKVNPRDASNPYINLYKHDAEATAAAGAGNGHGAAGDWTGVHPSTVSHVQHPDLGAPIGLDQVQF